MDGIYFDIRDEDEYQGISVISKITNNQELKETPELAIGSKFIP